jgi:hypothetical protein
MSAGNLTKQTILGAPFKWPWNRNNFNVQLDAANTSWPQDYIFELDDFAFVEKVWLTDPNGKVNEITNIAQSLAEESAVKRPSSAAMQVVGDDGFVTLRLNTLPDVAYNVSGCYQRTPVEITSMASTWAPIPDHLRYIYDWGFLGFVSLLTKDARAPIFLGKFTSHLLGAQDGLTALQRNIFLGNFLEVINQQGREQLATQQGAQARGNS